jgi:CRISPR-associated protein Cas5d
MKVERVSYDVITPSAARGILEAVLWKPAMRWVVERITVLKPIRHLAVRRNEVASKIPSGVAQWARLNYADRDFFADDDRQQRNAILLRDVEYVVHAVIELTERAGSDDVIPKFVEMFRRRVAKGQHFHQPYLGCREFPASVSPAVGTERPADELLGQEVDLGWMLHDIEYNNGRPKQPRFFHACMRDGVVEVPQAVQGVTR